MDKVPKQSLKKSEIATIIKILAYGFAIVSFGITIAVVGFLLTSK